MNIIESATLMREGKKVRRSVWPPGMWIAFGTHQYDGGINIYPGCVHFSARIEDILVDDWVEEEG